MKRFTWIMGLLFCTVYALQAKDRVIERPPFLAWSSTSIEIDKIVMSDTATTVYVKAFYQPKYWIKIATGSFLKDNNGALYPVRGGIGITLGKEFWMPESGEAEFQLLFPPIPENVTSLDFSEGDFDGAYQIWGIQLDKKAFNKFKLPKDIAVSEVDSKMELPEPSFQYSKAILKGRILDFVQGMPNEGAVYSQDIIRGSFQENEIKIQDDGTFYYEMDVLTVTPCILMFSLGTGMTNCLLAPGETSVVTINLREKTRKESHLHKEDKSYGKVTYYSGYLGGLQQELADNKLSFEFLGKTNEEHQQQMQEISGKAPEEYKAYILAQLSDFKKQVANSKCSSAYKELANIELELAAVQMIIGAERNLKSAYITSHGLKGEEASKYYRETKIEMPQGYYESLKDFPCINSPKACYATQYVGLLNIMGMVQTEVLKGFGDDGKFLSNNLKACTFGASIRDFNPLTNEKKAELASLPATYKEAIIAMNDDLLRRIEINKKKTGFTINEAGEVVNEDLFPSIISKFRGHTLLVDFWATWCGPCRMANKAMIPMKEELKDKDIVYLYITGETSPLGTWQNMIPDIHGEHFRVTDKQWSYLMQQFSIRGVPTYLVIDREGNITYKETGFPGVDIMKAQLTKALDK